MSDPKRNKPASKDGAASLPGGPSSDEISRQLKTYYESIVDEGIPDSFLDLLEKLDQAEKSGGGDK